MTIKPPVEFADEHIEFAEWVRDFGSKYSDSYLAYANKEEFPWDLAQALAEQGFLGMGTSEEFGGSGRVGEEISYVHLGIMQEELAYQNFELAQITYSCSIMGPLMEKNLQSEDREHWITGITGGKHIVAMGVTEPGSGSDVAGLRTKATKVDGGWLINGEKTSITFSPHAAGIVTLARTTSFEGEEGFTAFLVPLDSEGVTLQIFKDVAWKPMGRAGVFYDDVFVPDDKVLGPVNGGFRVILKAFDYARCVTGLMALGMGRRALDIATDYAKTRQTFGKTISHYQGVAFPLVERYTELEAAKWFCFRALSLADQGKPFIKEAAMCKYFGVDASIAAAREAVVVLGHNGISEEYPLQSLLRDIGGLQLGEGAPQIQKLVAARHIFGREFSS